MTKSSYRCNLKAQIAQINVEINNNNNNPFLLKIIAPKSTSKII